MEPQKARISISSASSPSRTPSPFLKPHERKDYKVAPKKAEVPPKVVPKAKAAAVKREASVSSEDDTRTKRKRGNSTDAPKDVKKVDKKESRKADKPEGKKKTVDEKKPAAASDVDSVISEKSKKRKKKNRDGSVSDESDKKKKRSKLKKHKKSSKKSSKRKDRSPDSQSEGQVVNEDLEKKLREKALVSLMRKYKDGH